MSDVEWKFSQAISGRKSFRVKILNKNSSSLFPFLWPQRVVKGCILPHCKSHFTPAEVKFLFTTPHAFYDGQHRTVAVPRPCGKFLRVCVCLCILGNNPPRVQGTMERVWRKVNQGLTLRSSSSKAAATAGGGTSGGPNAALSQIN